MSNNHNPGSTNHRPASNSQPSTESRFSGSGMNFITRFFAWCSGANTEILQKYPTEYTKYFGAGTAILMTAIFAVISSTYAISTIFENEQGEINYQYALIVGIAWGAFIFFLDRYLVSSIKKNTTVWNQVWIASPRLILAVLIGLTVARPLELKIFEDEILDRLKDQRAAQLQLIETEGIGEIEAEKQRHNQALQQLSTGGAIGPERQRIGVLEAKIEAGNEEVADALAAVQCECNGTCGTNKYGRGPACRKLEEEYARLKAEFAANKARWTSEINQINNRIGEINEGNDQLIAEENERFREKLTELQVKNQSRYDEKNVGFATSLLARHRTLSEMSSGEEKEAGVPEMIFVVTLLFVFIECAPILVKLMSKAGPYDQEVEDIEYQGRSDSQQRRFLTRQELKVNKDLINRMAIEQRTVLRQAIDEWRKEQLKEMRKKKHNAPSQSEDNHQDNEEEVEDNQKWKNSY